MTVNLITTWCARVLLLLAFLVTSVVALPATANATADAACSPERGAIGCINGTLRTEDGEPAVGVELTAEGPETGLSATSGEDGRWSIAVSEAGNYAVTLNTDTLPEGETLRDPSSNPRTVSVSLGSSAAALFPMGEPEDDAGPTDSPAADTPASPEDDQAAPAEQENPEGTEELAGSAAEGAGAGESAPRAGNNQVVQLAVSGLVFGLLLALAAVGANLIYGTTGLSNLAHGELVALGGLVAYTCVRVIGTPLWLGIVISVIFGAVVGFLLDACVFGGLRRRGVGVAQQLIVTVGISLALMNLLLAIYGPNPLQIVSGISQRINFGLFSLSFQAIWLVAVAAVVLGLVTLVLQKTRVGRATRAVSDNSALAAASGIDVSGIVRGVWISSTALAALGGAFLGLYLGSTRFNFGFVMLLMMFAAITLGGLGSPLGGIIGALIIGVIVEMSTLVLPNDLRYATALVLLIAVLLIRPQGILGRAQRIG